MKIQVNRRTTSDSKGEEQGFVNFYLFIYLIPIFSLRILLSQCLDNQRFSTEDVINDR